MPKILDDKPVQPNFDYFAQHHYCLMPCLKVLPGANFVADLTRLTVVAGLQPVADCPVGWPRLTRIARQFAFVDLAS